MRSIRFILTCFIFFFYTVSATAQKVEEAAAGFTTLGVEKYRKLFWDSLPQPVAYTNDYAWLFSTTQRNQLNDVIAGFEKKTTVEICIVTLDTFCVSAENFEALSLHIANTWHIGKRDKNNGILICINPFYRKVRIENGYGIEKYLTDQETKEIIDTALIPEYKKGAFFKGTLNALNAIISKLIEKKIR